MERLRVDSEEEGPTFELVALQLLTAPVELPPAILAGEDGHRDGCYRQQSNRQDQLADHGDHHLLCRYLQPSTGEPGRPCLAPRHVKMFPFARRRSKTSGTRSLPGVTYLR